MNWVVGPVAALALLAVLASPAYADALPPADCDSSSIGETCNTAGPTFNLPGTCTAEICREVAAGDSAVPPGDAGLFACSVCVLLDAGAGRGADAGGDSGADAAPDGGHTSASSSGGCAVSSEEAGRRGGGLVLAVAAMVVASARRSRRRTRRARC